MKCVHLNHSNPLLANSSDLQHRLTSADANDYRLADVLLMIGVVATIIALYTAMFVALYRWSHYDPVLPQHTIDAMPYVSESSM